MNNIIIENKELCLTVSPKCQPISLICKRTGEECLVTDENLGLFSLTEDRPYNNEIKLAHPNKRTVFQANRIRREGNRLIVGFELVTFEAIVEVREEDNYISFELVDFIVKPEDFYGLSMTPPPVAEFRLIQLPVKNREHFGEWLNVAWDDKAAVNVLANSPWSRIDSEKRSGYRIMTADAVRGIKLKGCSASLITTAADCLMDAIEAVEEDYDLPRGVASRRSDKINASVYWAHDVYPSNVDDHISYAKEGGFTLMLIYYSAFFKEGYGYSYSGDCDFNEQYPGGEDELKRVLGRIKAAGIIPGLHFLQTHIGLKSRYVTPVADHRLNLTTHFTLARPLSTDDTEVYVEQNPEGSVMFEKCRVLQFGGELIKYESYTAERPYKFVGCTRGHLDTNVIPHPVGTIGGILDISEFGASSAYIDQNTSLQDEVAVKLGAAYDCGFEFIYYDGSEGTNAPFEIHIPNAQYKVYKHTTKKPIFCEGAAKAHFSWHMLSGGNAFDIFPTPIFKEKIAQFPLEEAPRMASDFTRLNFGWWGYWDTTMPDVLEYGTSKAASWDCPSTIQMNLSVCKSNKRTPDNLEVMRRWEDVRARKWLTREQKEALRDPSREFILLVNEKGEYELCEYTRLTLPEAAANAMTAYILERGGRAYAVAWHLTDNADIRLALDGVVAEKQLGGERTAVHSAEGMSTLNISGRTYISGASKNELIQAFENVIVV